MCLLVCLSVPHCYMTSACWLVGSAAKLGKSLYATAKNINCADYDLGSAVILSTDDWLAKAAECQAHCDQWHNCLAAALSSTHRNCYAKHATPNCLGGTPWDTEFRGHLADTLLY